MPPKKGKGKKSKDSGDPDTKAEQKRIIDDIYDVKNIKLDYEITSKKLVTSAKDLAPDTVDYPTNLDKA